MHKYFAKSLQSIVVFPVMATSLVLSPLSGLSSGSPTVAAIYPETNRPLSSLVADNQQSDLDAKAKKIDTYFFKHNLPMAGHGKQLVLSAEKNDLPWSLVAAISMQESTGCKFIIPETNNCFGWGGGKIKFDSVDDGIEKIAEAIAGNNTDTSRYYDGKTLKERLRTYNGRAVHDYAESVDRIMSQIEQQSIDGEVNA